MSSSKRHSVAPSSGPKPPVNFSSSLTIPKEAVLVGTHSITIQSETLIHPRARFNSTPGSILIGRRCVIQERCQVGAEPQVEADEDGGSSPLGGGVTLGDYVVIEAGTTIESGGTDVGEGTVIQPGSKIGSGAKIGKYCTITSRSVIAPRDTVPDHTVVFANGKRRLDRRAVEPRKLALVKQISVSRKMIRSDPEKFQ
ncbi:dynactin 6 [Geosmithia morbida]|uniref:Dynactin subunit 6 n=1 Tax=Geosmithia morbida TaxID=1094350 RepID=A0A9P4YUL3_9HYPO|nr:dynactin 6 [Geosmithia morbida]KAF4122107.1 dynactin 6 [Geosmithia morbida]